MESSTSKKLQNLNKLSKQLEIKIFSTLLYSYNKDEAIEVASELNVKDFQLFPEAYNCVVMAVEKDESLATLLMAKNISVAQFLEDQSILSSLEFLKSIQDLKKVSATINYIHNCQNFVDKVDHTNLDSQIAEFASKIHNHDLGKNSAITAKQATNKFEKEQEIYSEKYKNGEKYLGTSTGFKEIDYHTEGIRSNYLYVLGGYSGIGKTTLALNFVESFLKQGKRVVMFSLEMSAEDIYGKIIGAISGVNMLKILKGNLSDYEREQVENAKCKYYDYRFNIYDNLLNFEQIKLAIIQENMQEKVDLVVIDYLQMLGSRLYKTEYERTSAFPNELKVDICRKLGIPVILLSQISNENAKNQDDVVAGFKGSGGIESAADLALKLIYNDKREDRDIKKQQGLCINVSLHMLKQRLGASGGIPMSFDGKIGRFYEGHDINLSKYI